MGEEGSTSELVERVSTNITRSPPLCCIHGKTATGQLASLRVQATDVLSVSLGSVGLTFEGI